MAATLYPSLKESLNELVTSTSPPPTQKPSTQLTAEISEIWQNSSATFDAREGSSKGPEIVRNVLELVGRDLVVSPLIGGELPEPSDQASQEEKLAFQTSLQGRLDVVLTLYEVVHATSPDTQSLEPGSMFIPLLEELVELVSADSWRDLFTYVETRSKRFTKDMPASRGKALPLLRTINAFLRSLPRTPADLVFRGRVHQFASSVINIADKSAINLRGEYGNLKTTWEEEVELEDTDGGKEDEGDSDVKMKAEAEGKPDYETEAPTSPESDFYSTLWSLQQYFAHPPSLDGPPVGDPPKSPFQTFREKTDSVLPTLFQQTQKERELLGKDADIVGRKRKRSTEEEGKGGFFHPRYLTGKRLLEHELADPSFRRQILVQYFILFQFLLNLTPTSASKQSYTGGMPKTFVIVQDDEAWVKQKVGAIREELRKMLGDGPRFEETVLSIITRERHYAQWKNDQCPEGPFEFPPLDPGSAKTAAELWKRRLAPPTPYTFKVGSRPLSRLWQGGFRSIDQLKGRPKTTTVVGLDEEIQQIEMDEEDDRAMGREPAPEDIAANRERKTTMTWRALRLAAQTNLRPFAALAQKRDLHIYLKAVNAATVNAEGAKAAPDTPTREHEQEEEDVEGLKRGSKEATAEVESEVKVPEAGEETKETGTDENTKGEQNEELKPGGEDEVKDTETETDVEMKDEEGKQDEEPIKEEAAVEAPQADAGVEEGLDRSVPESAEPTVEDNKPGEDVEKPSTSQEVEMSST